MTIEKDKDLQPFNTFGICAYAQYFTEMYSIQALQELCSTPKWKEINKLILGGGSNVLFTNDFPGIIIKNNISGIDILNEDDEHIRIKIGGGENWHSFVEYCVNHDYSGIENLSLIPGTVGAAPMQNIGAYGVEIESVFESLEAINLETGKLEIFTKPDCKFGYRTSIFKTALKNKYCICSVTLCLNKKHEYRLDYGTLKETVNNMCIDGICLRDVSNAVIQIRQNKLPNPAIIGNAGSFFKNPELESKAFETLHANHPGLPFYKSVSGRVKVPAAWLIEQCGWKGYRDGGIGVHDQQALVLVNHKNGDGKAIRELSEKIQGSVFEKFGITLNPEVNII